MAGMIADEAATPRLRGWQADRVLRDATFGAAADAADLRLGMRLLRAALPPPVLAPSGDRALFEKEADNFFEEALEQAQRAAPLLRDALRRRAAAAADSVDAPVALWRARRALQPAATAPPAEWYVWERRVQLAAWALGDEGGLHSDLLVSQEDHAAAAGFLCRDGPLEEA